MLDNRPDGEDVTPFLKMSSSSDDQRKALDDYRLRLEVEPITPREWLKERRDLAIVNGFREQLWALYCGAYPLPEVPGFVLLDVLGKGGMGQVFLARDEKLKRLAAIKEMTDGRRDDPHFQDRFLKEAEILAKFRSPNIVTAYHFLSHKGRDFIAMEYLGGGSLADRPIPDESGGFSATIRMLTKLARAIGYAHDAGIIHRDLKPGNILFDERDEPKFCDFGLAKDLGDPTERSLGMRMGTLPYMAPEQTIVGGRAVPGTDIWALGVILYRQLTGRMPFHGKDQKELFENIQEAQPPAMGPEIPADLRAICLKCLEKSPENRYLKGEDLALALEARVPPPVRRPWNTRLRRREWWLALAAATILLALFWVAAILPWPLPRPRPHQR